MVILNPEVEERAVEPTLKKFLAPSPRSWTPQALHRAAVAWPTRSEQVRGTDAVRLHRQPQTARRRVAS
ncbi:hypothetical protein QJS66_14230 [Kocuria rhizophila]|nr:hypothetical protein QJS66_14230 [Kocuria rhizophila]